jgi:Ca-activated chloride channel homolog
MNFPTNSRKHRRRRGAMLVFVCIMMFVFLAMAAISVNIAYMHMIRSEMRTAVDAAASATADTLSRTQNRNAALARGKEIAQENKVAGVGLELDNSDFIFGNARRDPETSKFVFVADKQPFNAIRVTADRSGNGPSGRISLFFGSLLGRGTFEPTQSATASFLDRDIVLVLDRSGSMEGQRMRDLKAAVRVFVNTLDKGKSSSIVGLASYSTSATLDSGLVSDKSIISQRSDEMDAAGMTSISSGMDVGLRILNGPGRREFADRTMIVMTDGWHNTGVDPRVSAERIAADNVNIHTITFGANPDSRRMSRIADIGGGKYFHADDGDELEEIFERIAETLGTLVIE